MLFTEPPSVISQRRASAATAAPTAPILLPTCRISATFVLASTAAEEVNEPAAEEAESVTEVIIEDESKEESQSRGLHPEHLRVTHRTRPSRHGRGTAHGRGSLARCHGATTACGATCGTCCGNLCRNVDVDSFTNLCRGPNGTLNVRLIFTCLGDTAGDAADEGSVGADAFYVEIAILGEVACTISLRGRSIRLERGKAGRNGGITAQSGKPSSPPCAAHNATRGRMARRWELSFMVDCC